MMETESANSCGVAEPAAQRTASRSLLGVRIASKSVIILLGAVVVWLNRFQMNADGISYLDIGDSYMRRDWHAAINSYWSPLYSWLAGFALWLITPNLHWEFPTIHILNLLIFVGTLFGFEFLLRELWQFSQENGNPTTDLTLFWLLGYLIFAYMHLAVDSILSVTPDLLVSALVYVAAGLTLRILRVRSTATAIVLGVDLGLAYLAKSAMFPFSFVLLLTLGLALRRQRENVALLAPAVLSFVFVAAPLVTVLSLKAHHLTFGGTARMNQGWWVNKMAPMYRHWRASGNFHAVHPTRELLDHPEVYEFAAPIPGTYPVWYDPTYWNEGLDSGFHLFREFRVFAANAVAYGRFLIQDMPLFLVILLLSILGSRDRKGSLQQLRRCWPIIAPVAFVLVMYACVHWEIRFLSGFFTLLGSVVISCAAWQMEDKRMRRAIVSALALLVLGSAILEIRHLTRVLGPARSAVAVADQLRSRGMQGERIALIGDGFTAYWARLAKIQIVAEVLEPKLVGAAPGEFFSLPADAQVKILALLRSTTARAVVAEAAPLALPSGWERVGDTGCALFVFGDGPTGIHGQLTRPGSLGHDPEATSGLPRWKED